MIDAYRQQLAQNNHRGLVVLSGQWSWCLTQLPQLNDDTLWLGDEPPASVTAITAKQAQQWLGRECSQLVINGFSGIDLNALGALTGTVKASGLCILICPEFCQWVKQNDPQSQRFNVYPNENSDSDNRWLKHLVNTTTHDERCLVIKQNENVISAKLAPVTIAAFNHPYVKTEQQQLAVEKIIKVATGHRRRPLVLTADRGRGKSSALGLAVCELFRIGKKNVTISAPKVSSTTAAFNRISEQFDVLEQTPTMLKTTNGQLCFVAPDELIRNKQSTDLLLIDEAAAIPAPMLTQILKAYSRVVFTSTIHGYEGTGRGFEVRFKKTLNQLTPDWQALHITTPIRFSENDPLEQWVNRTLMLDAKVSQVTLALSKEQSVFTVWNRDKLLETPQVLSQLMGLLTLSHYKTSPNDLRHLLDGSNIKVYTLSWQNQIIATALIAIEGGFDETLSEQIWQGNRRPKGHLLAQTLGYHNGFVEAPQMTYARVVRIAVHPQHQDIGLGSQLLDLIASDTKDSDIDFIGSSFGATGQLLRFWQRNGFQTLRVGITVEATSNEYSAVVLKALNHPAQSLLEQQKHHFDQQFAAMLSEFYPLLSADAVIELLQQLSRLHLPELSVRHKSEIRGYTQYNREYEFSTVALYNFTLRLIQQQRTKSLEPTEKALLVDKVLRKLSWQQVSQSLGYSGKKAAQIELKRIFKTLC